MIELRNLTKYYPVKNGIRYVLRDVSLIIPSRTNLAVLGPNGSGKSTFLRLIGGAEPADSGTILTDEEISWPLGLTSGFQGSLTGRQNVLFVCRINGLGAEDSREVINQVVTFAEIGEYLDMPVNTYSSGMRARLSFGLSMVFDFDVYLVDELTSVGDMIFREKAKAAFESIRKRASLIFVSHNLKTLKQSCQSALFLRDGMADFYPDIDEGIEAYTAYMQDHRNNSNPKRGSTTRSEARAAAKASRVAARSVNQALLPAGSEDAQDGDITPGQESASPGTTRASRRAARRAARREKLRNEREIGTGPDPSPPAQDKTLPPGDDLPPNPARHMTERKTSRRAARKRAARRLRRSEKAATELAGSDTPAPSEPDSPPEAAAKTIRQAARKAARRNARPEPS